MELNATTPPRVRGFRPWILTAALLLVAGLPDPASAQYFGRNKVQYETFDFKILKTPHFDIHFYPEEGDAVEDATRMAERWYERLARLFQHEFEQPKPLILYADHPDFQQTNTLRGSISEGTGGVTESLKNRVIMPLGSSYGATDHVLGHELVHAFQYNIAQSRSGTGIRGLALLPLWLVEGMAEYISVGREDPLTAMWMRDAVRRGDLPNIRQMSNGLRFFPYRFGQALWAYIGGRYGDDAVVDVYRRALRVGWEPALSQVLGTSSDSLSVQWRRSIEEEYLPEMVGRQAPGEVGVELLSPATGSGQQNVSPSVSPDGRYVAFLSEKDLFSIDLYIADARTGEIIRKLVSANSDPHFDALRFIDSAGDWSPDGSQFVFIVTAEGDNELSIVDVESGDIQRKIDIDEVGAISNPAWSPDGATIAFTGTKGGISDLYLYDVETEAVRQLTHDRYADMQPAWSPDGRTIAITSDRGLETDFEKLTYGEPRIAFVDVATGSVEVLDVFGDVKHINPQYAPDGRSIYFVSDQDGFSDIYQYTLATGDLRRITQIATGVSGITSMSPAISVAEEAGNILFSVFDQREFHIYSLAAAEADAGGETVVASTEAQPARLLPPTRFAQASRIAEYLLDWETGLVPLGTYTADMAREYDSSLSLDYVGQPSLGVGTDQFGSYVGGGAAAFFSDMLGNRSLGVLFQANGTLKDIGGQVFYLNQERRLNWGASAAHIPVLQGFQTFGQNEQGQPYVGLLRQRIFVSNASFITAYPFSTTRRIELDVGIQRYAYDVEEDRFYINEFGQIFDAERVSLDQFERQALNLGTASLALVGDKSFFGFVSPVSGSRWRMEVGGVFGTENFMNVTADYRRYFSPNNHVTFAVRGLHVGRYGSELTREFDRFSAIQPYFLGYETLIRGYAFETFENVECVAAAQEAGAVQGNFACPGVDRMFGHKFGIVNTEFRIPLLGSERFGLLNFPVLPTELLLFGDAGVAWNQFDEIDFEFERTSARRVPVFSAGLGARMNLLGVFILQTYFAYPFQRPEKGWHWGFVLEPGGW